MDFFASEIDELDEKNVRILILVIRRRLPKSSATLIEVATDSENTGLHLNIALNYGGRAEFSTCAARLMAQEAAQAAESG